MTCQYTIDGKDYTLAELKAFLVEGGIDRLYPDGKFPWSEAKAESEKPLLDQHKAINERLASGNITADELRSEFEKLVANGDSVIAELSKFTKAELEKRIRSYIRPDAKKADLVDDAYESMITDYWFGEGLFSFSYGFGSKESVAQVKAKKVRQFLESVTNESIQKHAEEIKQAKQKLEEERKAVLAGMDNPQELNDYYRLLRAKMSDGMTFQQARMTLSPEQRAAFDEMSGLESRDARKARADQQKTDVRATVTTTSGDIIETKHTKTGEDLFVVKAADRVERETYNQWNATAKRLGGYYSSFRGAGAVPGFQFKTRDNAQAFLQYLGGDVAQAKEAIQERRDAYADDKSQSAVERLNEMADRLQERGEESLNRDRKANTTRRAGMAARAEAAARYDVAMAETMRNIAKAIESNKAKFLDRVRTKSQVEMLQSFVSVAQGDKIRAQYDSYGEQEKHKYDKPNGETADYAKYPDYTMYRSDWAALGRRLLEQDSTKSVGQAILKEADDLSAAYEKFAKDNLEKVSKFRFQSGLPAIFKAKKDAENSAYQSGYKGTAVPLKTKDGWRLVVSPSEAVKQGIWNGDVDKRISFTKQTGEILVEKLGNLNRKKEVIALPWQIETAYEKQKRLASMGIETPSEFRAALREFISLSEAPKEADKIKEMERAMIGRANDGLDFFPTPIGIAEQMVETADIKEGMSVLEPSAGMGHIAERIREAGVEPDVIELSNSRKELLEAKGFNVVGRDFLETEGAYDRIIMNPPFGDRRDAAHVQHAYDLLKPGGRLVAIMGEGVFFGSDKKAQAFRDWLEERGGTDEKLEEGTFKDPSLPVTTGVNARMVVIDKPDTETAKFSKSLQITGSTVADITALLPKRVKALLDAGKLKVVQSVDDVPLYSKLSGIEGLYDTKRDQLYLVADMLNKGNLNAVLSHELYHRGLATDEKLKSAHERFKGDMQRRFDLSAKGIGTKADNDAYARVMAADTPVNDRIEEFAAYQVSQWQTNPDSVSSVVRKAIADFIAAIRAFLIRNGLDMGFIRSLTPADLAAMANYGAKVASQKVANSKAVMESESNPDIRYSKATNNLEEFKRKAGLGSKPSLSEEIKSILQKGIKGNRQVIQDKWNEIKPMLEQGIFDKFIGIKLAEKEILGDVVASQSGYIGARLSTGSSSTMAAVLQYGAPEWRDGVISLKKGSKSFSDALKPIKDDLENFAAWMVANRANRLFSEGKEKNFTRAEIDAGLSLEKPEYKKAAQDIADLNKSILDLAEKSGLIESSSRKLWESADYIPFYRLMNGQTKAPKGKGGLSHQSSGIRALKGGDNPLSDPLGNLMMNWAHLIDASMKNNALDKTLKNLGGSRFIEGVPRVEFKSALVPKSQIKSAMRDAGLPDEVIDAMPPELTNGIAKMWAMQAPTDPDVVRVMRNGQSEYFKVKDGMLLTSLVAVNQSPLTGIFKPLRYFKTLLTSAVTADPTFMARNFIRDSMHSWTIAEEKGFKLGVDSIRGAVKSFKEEGGYIDMMFAGASFQGGYGNYNNPDAARESMDSVLRKRGIKDTRGFKDSVLDTPKKWWEAYRSIGDAIENASREAILENAKRAGKERAEYLYEAKDLMDFSMQGSFMLIRGLNDMLPFFNARLQGLYRLARAGKTKEARNLILKKGASMAMMSLALLALNSNNDDYEALEDWDKDQYWHFFFGDQHYRIPKPFELGLIFGTIPERSARLLVGSDSPSDFAARMGHAASDTLAFNPIPQAFRPFLELYANKDMFTGRPIENMSDENKLPSARYNENTSETMRKLSEWLPEALGASPKRLEHLMQGYTGAMGMYLLGASDLLVRAASDMPEEPAMRIDRLPVIKAFYQQSPAMHTKYGTDFYEMLNDVNQIQSTINAYQKEGNIEKANELMIENSEKLKFRKQLTSTGKSVRELRQSVDRIYRSNLSADEKRQRIDNLFVGINQNVKDMVLKSKSAFN